MNSTPAQATVEATQWEVRPAGIEDTRFADPESFYLLIKRGRRQGETTFVVTPIASSQTAYTRHGKMVYLRHNLHGRHAHHATFEDAVTLARALADGTLRTEDYRYWRAAEAERFD